MKLYVFFILAAIAVAECGHTFLGTNVQRPQVYHKNVQYSSLLFQKRIEYLDFRLPSVPYSNGRAIRGILAYDRTFSDASANITTGGLGYTSVQLRMKSSRGKELNYDIYIYA